MGRNAAAINSAILIAPILLVCLVTAAMGFPIVVLLALASVLSVISIALLFASKFPKLRQGDLFSLGVGELKIQRRLYAGAYIMLFLALAAWVSLALSGAF